MQIFQLFICFCCFPVFRCFSSLLISHRLLKVGPKEVGDTNTSICCFFFLPDYAHWRPLDAIHPFKARRRNLLLWLWTWGWRKGELLAPCGGDMDLFQEHLEEIEEDKILIIETRDWNEDQKDQRLLNDTRLVENLISDTSVRSHQHLDYSLLYKSGLQNNTTFWISQILKLVSVRGVMDHKNHGSVLITVWITFRVSKK